MLETKRSWRLSSTAAAFFAGALAMAQVGHGQDSFFVPIVPGGQPLEVDGAIVESATISLAPTDMGATLYSDAWVAADGDFTYVAPHMDDSMYLDWPNIQKELELAEDQIRQIQKAREASAKAMNEYFKEHQKPGKNFDPKKMQEFMTENQRKSQEAVKEALLPHQQRRLKQVGLQMRMQHQGVSGALMSKEVAEELGISETQQKQLQKTARDSRVAIQKEMERLQAEAKEKLLSSLTETQRKKLKELTGEKMKHQGFGYAATSVSKDEDNDEK